MWCHADCEDDAHRHVVGCPAGNGNVYGDVASLGALRLGRRQTALGAALGRLEAEAQRVAGGMLGLDTVDLGLELTQ